MTNTLLRAGALSCALLASTALTAPAMAQSAPAPRFQEIDANGVDLISGRFVFQMVEGSIGSGDGAVSLMRSDRNDYGRLNQWQGSLSLLSGGTEMLVQFGARSERFTLSGATWVPQNANGATLTGGSGTWNYTSADGITVGFALAGSYTYGPCAASATPECLVVVSVARPNGTTFAVDWTLAEHCFAYDPELFECISPGVWIRQAGVSSSTGYSFTMNYPSVVPWNASWTRATGATFTNNVTAPATNPTVTYTAVSSTVEDITDTGGQTWRITRNGSGAITGIRRPGAGSDNVTVTYGAGGIVSAVTRDGVATGYARSVVGTNATTTITDAASQVTTVVADLVKSRITSVTDPLSRTTEYQYDSDARLTRTTYPEDNEVNYTYDARGNVTGTRAVAKPGSGLPDMVTSASYDASCANALTCNQPNSVTDARGNVTDYTYDGTHGGVLTVTAPAATGGGTRPQTRYSYTLTNGEYRPTGISACASGTAPSCVGTADESRVTIAWDANANATSVTRQDGTGALSATQAMTYDPLGNMLTVDGPLSGSADTTRYRYDAARRVIGVVGPDPDGSGGGNPLKHRAVRATYTNGLQTSVEQGTVDSQSDGDWAAFTPLQRVEQDYDANARPTVQRLMSGSTTYQLTQTSYDNLGRVRCVAQRMNPAEFASLPSDACTLDTQGSYGPDRIARTSYDNAGQVTLVETGYGVSGVAADEAATTYSGSGLPLTVTDANGNRTTYVYDGHDRLSRTRMPDPSTAGTSSATDYEELTYATATVGGNAVSTPLVSSRRLRGGASIGYGYDNLGRLNAVDVPPSGSTLGGYGDYDRLYLYDNLGRLTAHVAVTGLNIALGYDALGRQVSEASYSGTKTMAYDLAGRMTRLTWASDGLYVDYDRLVTGEVSAIRENGASSGAGVLATYAWDNLGRRTSLTRGNGTVTGYSYDNVSRLTQLTQNLNSTPGDLTLDFTHNPSGEIVSNTRSNDAYSYTAHANANVANNVNGLNQVTAIGGASVSHDARGNADAVGSDWYSYTSENLLVQANATVIAPDARLQPWQVYDTGTGAVVRFDYLGGQLVGEYDASNALQRRYVPGPDMDEPVVWYEGSGTSTRRWFHADERGSVVAVSDASGDVVTAVNRYDEYGNAQGTLTGRFGYTGQAWLPEAGLYHYRARAYNPAMGRFMQTDPIGFGGGMNFYAYVGNNPINMIDPMGMRKVCVQEPQSRMSRCVEVDDENGDGVVDSTERASAEAWLRFQFSNPEIFQSNSQETIEYERSLSALAHMLDNSGLHYYQDTAMTLAMDHDAREFLSGRISEREFWSRAISRAGGVATGAVLISGSFAAAILARAGFTALFARGGGWLNSNNYVRIGLGWKGSATGGSTVFRISIGHRSWERIPGLPSFPWHFP